MKLNIFIFLLLVSLKISAQKLFIVADSLSKDPLAASVRDAKKRVGINADVNGQVVNVRFKEKVLISHVGYKTKILHVQTIKDTVFLQSNSEIGEIVVMPDSVLKVLLRNAYKRIEQNYPQKPFYIQGLYQETAYNDESDSLNRMSESTIKVLHPSFMAQSKEAQGKFLC